MYSGVHNGMRNMVLYQLDQKMPSFKKYRIPSPNNPFFTYQDWIDAIKRYGGEDTDLFLQLVLAKPGSASFSVINRDAMIMLPVPFYNYRYSSTDKSKGRTYKDTLQLPKLFKNHQGVILGIDTGFVDPTIIQLYVKENGVWRAFARWKLSRIEFPEQEEIIDWIATYYSVNRIGLDTGPGGGGNGILQSFTSRPDYAHKKYESRIIPVNFGEQVNMGDPEKDEVINVPRKTYAGNQIAQIIEKGILAFSEMDAEGISQIERIAKQKTPSGVDRFFVMSDKGTGASTDDHIFASYICFVTALFAEDTAPAIKKLGVGSVTITNK